MSGQMTFVLAKCGDVESQLEGSAGLRSGVSCVVLLFGGLFGFLFIFCFCFLLSCVSKGKIGMPRAEVREDR